MRESIARALFSEELSEVIERESSALDRVAEGATDLVLFGCGHVGRRTLSKLRSVGVEPRAFADNNPQRWNTVLDGIPVLSPSEAASRHGSTAVFALTICQGGPDAPRVTEIMDALRALGSLKIASFSALCWKYPEALLAYFALDLPHKAWRERDLALGALALFSDEPSRNEYLGQLEWRLTGEWSALARTPVTPEYFYEDTFSQLSDETFVDCGAYDGDTLRAFIHQRSARFSQIVALEPDGASFAALSRYRDSLAPEIRARVTVLPFASGRRRETLRFDPTGATTSRVSESGGIEVQSVPLDEVLAAVQPTFIKMDIEGSESLALEGASRSIATHRPVLAVCVYHRQTDLWQIPLQIHSLCPDYSLFLRPHSVSFFDLVCYAVPPERLTRQPSRPGGTA